MPKIHCKFGGDSCGRQAAQQDGEVVTHLALALNADALHKQVVQKCDDSIAIPSVQWLRWQFWPKHAGRLTSKEFAVKFREHTTFVCQDDKHSQSWRAWCAAVERGRQVLVAQGQKFEVSDHDFCKFSMTPSVSFKVNIPEDMSGNFYSGTVFVGLKDFVFEPSSSLRHLVEYDTISPHVNPVECHYHDGGPDNIQHMRNKLANISYFLHRNLDMLCSIQTPPYHSWKNPCEECMSLLNLGLQGVGISRQETETCETHLKNTRNLGAIRKLEVKYDKIVSEIEKSLKPTKDLMDSVLKTCH